MSPTSAKYAGTATNVTITGNNWTPLSAAQGAPDGVFAVAGMPSGGAQTDAINLTNFGFSIPATAVVDGVFVEFDRQGSNAQTNTIQLLKAGSVTGSFKIGTDIWPISEAFTSYGGASDAWGATLTGADVNNSGFGVQLQAVNTHGGGSASLDALRVTVYWHAAPTNIPRTKYYIYKVFDSITGNYLGNLPNVVSDFAVSQDINTGGAQITVQCGVSADTSGLAADQLTDELGNVLTDESNIILTDEGVTPQTGIGTGSALIRDGNAVQVWEYGYYHINGINMFSGVIERHEDNFGGDTNDDTVKVLIYSDGSDMDNHLVRGSPFTYTGDVTQTSQNASAVIYQYDKGGYNYYGQVWKVGAGVTNCGAISLLLNGTANVTINVYTDANLLSLLGSVSQSVSVGSATEIQFTFPLHIPVTAANSYFFTVSVDSGQSITIYYSNANPYANGDMYNANFGGGSGGGAYYVVTGNDLYFKTFSTNGSTTATFTSVDPTSGMLTTVMGDYSAEGGKIGVGNIQTSGLTLSYGFNTNTVYQGLQSTLTIAPSGYYYYVDLGYDLLYFQQANTQADYILTKGVHINKLTIVSTIEYVINACYVIGGVVAGSSIYTLDLDYPSINRYGLRLNVHTDNNITNTTTAHAVGSSVVADGKNEQYQTVVSIPDKTMDITLLVPGKIIGFNGFGTYVDGLLAQIVHRDYTSEQVTLTLGILPKRNATDVDQVVRGLAALSTITNPTAPS